MYDHASIEQQWEKQWEKDQVYRTDEDTAKEPCYALVMFPYPSGKGLHIGHARPYICSDVYVRLKRMQGYRVLHPMGWDAFGLPAEEYAIKHNLHPRESTERNIAVFKKQAIRLGLSYDWDREISTCDPAYYKWTQWIFLQLYKKGLAYESHAPVNWCPSCKTGLANEDLEGGRCERCDSVIERKPLRQWVLRITDYAEKLLADLDTLTGWPHSAKEVQRNWIGRSEGYTIPFVLQQTGEILTVFTTRPDTLYGCSFVALSPEHPILDSLLDHVSNRDAVVSFRNKVYVSKAGESQQKDGVQLKGVHVHHPLTDDLVPVFVADFVLSGHGTGAIFGSPAHDTRDFAFAKQHNLPIVQVIAGDGSLPLTETAPDALLLHSGKYTGHTSEQAKQEIVAAVGGKESTAYRLQDWVFSRQRYWGEPIPLIHCSSCGVVPVPEDDLPVVLPDVSSYEPTGTGESPLALIEDWVSVSCPSCGGAGKRETNTMPQWAGSSWYHLRYIDAHNDTMLINPEKEKQWMPVTLYTGGMEHAARHLIYARFWHKVLQEIGVTSTSEPYAALRTVGIVQAEGGGKMSKRLGNVVDPISVVDVVGADALRIYIAQMAPFSQTVAWDSKAIAGPRRFLERVYALVERAEDSDPDRSLLRLQHETILAVTHDIESYRFNTAVSSLMIFAKALHEVESVPKQTCVILVQLLAPFAPFLCETLWRMLGYTESVHRSVFPQGDPALAQRDEVVVAVQVHGKTRGTVTVLRGSSQDVILEHLKKDARLAAYIKDCSVRAFVEDTVISFV